jgi:putative chitinase
LTVKRLRAAMPNNPDPETWAPVLERAMTRYIIDSPPRAAAFLAHLAHESQECRTLKENLNYSAVGLVKTWPKRFPDLAAAEPYAKNPERIANLVYADRLGNGPVSSGDGWRYRGRGLIQLTGRSNYASLSDALKVDFVADPDKLLTQRYAAMSAGWFWKSRGLNELADDRADDDDSEDFRQITKIINGGLNGLKERLQFWALSRAAYGIA